MFNRYVNCWNEHFRIPGIKRNRNSGNPFGSRTCLGDDFLAADLGLGQVWAAKNGERERAKTIQCLICELYRCHMVLYDLILVP